MTRAGLYSRKSTGKNGLRVDYPGGLQAYRCEVMDRDLYTGSGRRDREKKIGSKDINPIERKKAR